MRCMHFVATLDHGGTEVTCRDIATWMLSEKGIEARVVTFAEASGSIREELERITGHKVAVVPRDGGRLVAGLFIVRQMLGWRPNAILLHLFGFDHLFAGLIARLLCIRHISVKAGNPPSHAAEFRWRAVLFLNWLLRIRVVAASHYIYQRLSRLGPLPAGSLVIHNGCKVESIFEEAERARGAERRDRPLNFGMISRLDPIKDHQTLIRAFKLLADKRSDTMLTIVGDGFMRNTLVQLVSELSLEDKVIFTGTCKEVARQLGTMHVFVLSTTEDEGFGIVLIEALASGTPILATDVPACREVLNHGEFGTLLPPRDVNSTAQAMERLLHRLDAAEVEALEQLPKVREAYRIESTALKHARLLGLVA